MSKTDTHGKSSKQSESGNRAPRLRFPGFEGEWEEKKLGEVFEKNEERNTDCTIGFDKTISVATMVYNPSGNGAADESLRTYKVLRVGDIAFEGNKSKNFAYGRFVMNDIGVGIMSPRFRSLRPKTPLVVDFWKKLINYEPLMRSRLVNSTKQGTMMNELIVDEILKQTVPVPSLPEQQKIAACLSEMDKLIAAEEQKAEGLRAHKKGLMQRMFPQNGERVPRLRFPGFEGEWEEKRFGEIYLKNNVKNDLSFGVDKVISVANMYYKSDAVVSGADYLKTYNVFRLGDIAYEGNKSANFSYGRFVENTIGDGIVSHVFDVYSPISSDYCVDYWKHVINYEGVMRPILEKSTKQSTMMNSLVERDFLKQTVSVPSLPEQQKIASCLSEMDKLIAAEEERVEVLRAQKKGLMQRMFPEGVNKKS